MGGSERSYLAAAGCMLALALMACSGGPPSDGEPDPGVPLVSAEVQGWRSTYWKLRRRGAFDFPALGVAVAARLASDGTVEEARLALGAAASQPFLGRAGEFLTGKRLTDDVIAEAARMTASRAKPVDNADFDVHWRKRVAVEFAGYALKEIRGDDTQALRRRIAGLAL